MREIAESALIWGGQGKHEIKITTAVFLPYGVN